MWGTPRMAIPRGWRRHGAGDAPRSRSAQSSGRHRKTRAPPAQEEYPGSPQVPNTPMPGGLSALEPPARTDPRDAARRHPGGSAGPPAPAAGTPRLPPRQLPRPPSSPRPPAPPYRVGRRRRARTAGCALRPRGKCGCGAAELRDRRGGTGQDRPPGPPRPATARAPPPATAPPPTGVVPPCRRQPPRCWRP